MDLKCNINKNNQPIIGIYGIFNVESNKVLVGSSTNVIQRWRTHKCHLRKKRHPNIHFQSSWDKYGKDVFEFRILEECPEDMLIVRENSWMNYYNSLDRRYGYNMQIAMKGTRLAGDKNGFYGCHHTEETKKKLSEQHKGMKYSEETKKKLSAIHKGKPLSEEHKNKIRLSRLEKYRGVPSKGAALSLTNQ